MTLREALRSKKHSLTDMNLKINSWSIYGEDTVVLFYSNWECSARNLDKLLDYLALVDKLVVALPKGAKEDTIFQIVNIQAVDGVVLYDSVDDALGYFSGAKFAFEGTSPTDTNTYKSRTLAL